MRFSKLYKSILCAVAVFAASGYSASASDDLYKEIMKAGKIKVATDLAIPPSGMLDENLQPVGSDVETAKLLAKDWGLELEFVKVTAESRIPTLLTKKADILISTLAITDERKKVVDFTMPYAAIVSVIGAPANSDIKSWDDVRGKEVTVTRGVAQDAMVTKMAAEKGITVVRYSDDATMVTAALSGQAKIVASSASIVQAIGKRDAALSFEPKFSIGSLPLGLGVRKDEPELLAKLNEWVAANRKNGNLNDIYKKFHGADLPAELQQ